MQKDLTKGNMLSVLVMFSLPYMLSCFLQTFYGLADLFIIGMFNGPDATTAVSVGSQLMHMITVIIIGLAMGSTVMISQCLGAKQQKKTAKIIGNTVILFLIFAFVSTIILIICSDGILKLLLTPKEAFYETKQYILVCFAGIPFITAYNVISCVLRGMGDSKTPMYFVFLAGIINIVLDIVFVGAMGMSAMGAAMATVFSQAVSVVTAIIVLKYKNFGVKLSKNDFIPDKSCMKSIIGIGIPTAAQDGFIQISFLVITAIANNRGVTAAASVGIVEKIISFLFLVPSAMLASVSAIAAQNAGAGRHEQGRLVLRYALTISVVFGFAVAVVLQFLSAQAVGLFTKDADVIEMGRQYLTAYVWDVACAGVHFCFSGYFCAYKRAYLSFLHNCIAICLVRIPGAYWASVHFPNTLYPMGAVVPLGSALSAAICIFIYAKFRNRWYENNTLKI